MKKLSLQLDTLEVASFETAAPEPSARGTVAAHAATPTISATIVVTVTVATAVYDCWEV